MTKNQIAALCLDFGYTYEERPEHTAAAGEPVFVCTAKRVSGTPSFTYCAAASHRLLEAARFALARTLARSACGHQNPEVAL